MGISGRGPEMCPLALWLGVAVENLGESGVGAFTLPGTAFINS